MRRDPDTGNSPVRDMGLAERDRLQSRKKFACLDDPVLDCPKLEGLIEQAKLKLKSDYLVVFIDLATMMKEFSGEDPRGFEKGMDAMSQMAKRHGVHFVQVVQANQKILEAHAPSTVNGLKVFRPSLANVKNSGAIAERSRTVLSVFREKYYAVRFFPEDPEVNGLDDVMEVQILKQSNGDVGRVIHYLHIAGQFLLLPVQDTSELRTIQNLREDRLQEGQQGDPGEARPQVRSR
jgi:hypothetical protein